MPGRRRGVPSVGDSIQSQRVAISRPGYDANGRKLAQLTPQHRWCIVLKGEQRCGPFHPLAEARKGCAPLYYATVAMLSAADDNCFAE